MGNSFKNVFQLLLRKCLCDLRAILAESIPDIHLSNKNLFIIYLFFVTFIDMFYQYIFMDVFLS